ncbi:hypothetical protein [Variovorax dokdonensis]
MRPQLTIVLLGGAEEARGELARALERLARQADATITVRQQVASDEAAHGQSLHLLLHSAIEDGPWREQLARLGLPFSVLHGDIRAQITAAWTLAALRLGMLPTEARTLQPAESRSSPVGPGTLWRCDKCSDPECEHRLFRDLLAKREGDVA